MVYHGLLLAAQYFAFALLIDSIHSTNTLELLAFFAFQVCSFVYTVVQVYQEQELDRLIVVAWPDSDYSDTSGGQVYRLHTNLATALMGVNAAFLLAWVFLFGRMLKDWGWKKFRRTGADPVVRRRVWWHQVFVVLLKIDAYFFVGFGVVSNL